MKLSLYLIIIFIALYSACNNNTVGPDNSSGSNYKKVFTTGNTANRFEIYSATSDSLVSGYNDIGFKVFQNNEEMTSGFVKFSPRMHHPPPISSFHSTPVSPQFNYDNDKKMFMGYLSFIMVSDTLSTWYGFFNYNNSLNIDSVIFRVLLNSSGQMRTFVDDSSQTSFWITLVSPRSPDQGLNDFKCLLHTTQDGIYYTEFDSAQMFIFPWMNLMGHGSSNNINPVYSGGRNLFGKG